MATDSQSEFPTVYVDSMLLMVGDQLLQCPEGIVVSVEDVAVGRVGNGDVRVHVLMAS